jgi:Ca2+-binding RTX toxin-like protein
MDGSGVPAPSAFGGMRGNDVVMGGAGNDNIHTGSGNDTVFGGGGADTLDGGDGDDTLVWALVEQLAGVASATGGAGRDTLRIDTEATPLTLLDADLAKASAFEVLELAGTAAQTLTLSAAASAAFAQGITLTAALVSGLQLNASASTVALTVTGSSQADTLAGGLQNDVLDGGDGVDVAVYTGLYSDYTFAFGANGIDITDQRQGATNQGRDQVRNVEWLQFADQTLSADAVEWASLSLTVTPQQVLGDQALVTGTASIVDIFKLVDPEAPSYNIVGDGNTAVFESGLDQIDISALLAAVGYQAYGLQASAGIMAAPAQLLNAPPAEANFDNQLGITVTQGAEFTLVNIFFDSDAALGSTQLDSVLLNLPLLSNFRPSDLLYTFTA